jgi:hypothetical protein
MVREKGFEILFWTVFWIWIPIGSGSKSAKMTTKIEEVKKFHVLKCWMFSFEEWRLLL